MVALTGRNEAYYTDYRGYAAGVRLGGQVRLSLPGPVVPWQQQRRGAPALDLGRRASSLSRRTTTRSPTPAAASGPHSSPVPARCRAHDGAAAARPPDADALPGPGVRRIARRSLLRRPRAGAGRARCDRAGAGVPGAVPPVSRRAAMPGLRCPTRTIRGHFERASSITRERASATRRRGRCTAICCALRREDPVLPPRSAATASMAPCSAARRSCCGSSAADGDDRLLFVNLGRDLHLDPRPSRCWRRRRARAGACSGRARTRATAASACSRPTATRTAEPRDPRARRAAAGRRTGVSRARPRW